ncbi:MAG: two-component system sensor histidine kinase CreC, partial [Verrucomicrobiales bacterium]|nr:two-component system sensor histidine kinase CreC [Verrucomicrobiales bacterium]
LPKALERKIHALIFDLEKNSVTCHVHVTDAHGIVIFDSDKGTLEGTDLSKFNDVRLTLQGQYGARSSRSDEADEMSSVIHVAAPIRHGDKIIGALVVRKAKLDQWRFIESQRNNVIISSALIGFGIAAFCAAVLFWVLRPIRLLTAWTQSIAEGRRAPQPNLGGGLEVRALGAAINNMREELDGRDYATSYVQTLTHELKSPLAAIRGTAELLQEEDMPEEDRRRFLANLQAESDRSERLLRQLLRLSEVERRRALNQKETFDLRETLSAALQETATAAAAKEIRIVMPEDDTALKVEGDAALLRRAFVNLIENAVDFSPEKSSIEISAARQGTSVEVRIRDHGPGIPEYAAARLFERFYSLKHQQTGRKGTGLGLAFVKETVDLHHGTITVANHPDGGTLAAMTIPAI